MMKLLFVAILVLAGATEAATVSRNLSAQVIYIPPTGTSTVEKPGPSAALLASATYPHVSNASSFQVYSCVRNFYVNISSGSDSNNGSSGSPWQHLSAANTSSRTGGDCINVAAGTYDLAGSPLNLNHGGTTASATGYVTYRCQTLDACIITSSTSTTDLIEIDWLVDNPGAGGNYFVIDGFELSGANTANFSACINWQATTTATATASHHVWILNSLIHDCGQGGVQNGESEFVYILHNNIYNNSYRSNSGAQGSGVSLYIERQIAGYSNTAADIALEPFHAIVNWNVINNNRINEAFSVSDGNGVIIDNNQGDQQGGSQYTQQTLIAFNVVYNNGGTGICPCAGSSNVTMANNSVYNNYLDTNNGQNTSARAGMYLYAGSPTGVGSNNTYINNISWGIPGAGNLSSNTGWGTFTVGATAANDVWTNNISNGAAEEFNGGTFSCSTNKCNPTNPQWVAVGNVSTGNVTTPPNGVNFALGGSSPAIGYGLSESYLSPQSVDAGACFHTLTPCP